MKKVQFLTSTAYQGPRKEGDVVNVPDDFAARWVKNGIAQYTDKATEDDVKEPTVEEPVVEEPVVNEQIESSEYDELTAKELFELCKEKNIEVEPKKGRAYYVEKLSQ